MTSVKIEHDEEDSGSDTWLSYWATNPQKETKNEEASSCLESKYGILDDSMAKTEKPQAEGSTKEEVLKADYQDKENFGSSKFINDCPQEFGFKSFKH